MDNVKTFFRSVVFGVAVGVGVALGFISGAAYFKYIIVGMGGQ
jgi:hypothetical protein